ncbi:spr peptidase [Cricetibacter osteomyelitidis]|uniref:Spr peptidase n=1 Tax=Cricetibacter osteomyelitidis TaxID=1521931 RepID=A0A4R2T1I0_9PAST|nr:NlpC/P60 family protein [Cricetibacter osteomyelitidis]TCP94976.1 spr peptidase [Cricetibacter osteomyelitidis]
MFKQILMITALLALTACSSSVDQTHARYQSNKTGSYGSKDEVQLNKFIVNIRTNQPHNFGADENDAAVFNRKSHAVIANKKLSQVFQEWHGTRYRLGGTGKRGIDCSAFMREVFEQAFGMSLPRSTSEQRHIGRNIAKSQLKVGDLVFFRRNNHVGVYIGEGRFMHASSRQGVTISSLSESYWARNYTQSRRVL